MLYKVRILLSENWAQVDFLGQPNHKIILKWKVAENIFAALLMEIRVLKHHSRRYKKQHGGKTNPHLLPSLIPKKGQII